MTREVAKAPDLAALLELHREEVATTWAEMVHRLPDPHYREQPLEELSSFKVNRSHPQLCC